MICELQPSQFAQVSPLFAGLENRVAIQAIIHGHTRGRIFADNAAAPTVAFMWNDIRYSFLGGDPNNETFNSSLRRLLTETLLPEAQDSHDPTLVLYPHPTAWAEKIEALVGHRPLIRLARKTFAFDPARFHYHDWPTRLPAGYRMQPINPTLLAGDLGFLWRSTDDFLAHGAGFCLLQGNEIVSSCFSAFAGGGKYEIIVDTHPEHRQKGLATVTAAAFIQHCLQRGIEPVWECWADNTPSVGLAQKLGFRPQADYPVYFVPPSK